LARAEGTASVSSGLIIMIQRIQTVYLIVAAVAMIFSAITSFGFLSAVITALVAACISLYTIFLYKKRPLQANICRILMACGIAYITFHCLIQYGNYAQKDFILPVAAAVLACFCWLLAARAIMKDEKLVRSLDRIR